MANVKNNVLAVETQRRLLEAAGEVFAECGFHNATIKTITSRAGACVASVNYHFNDKAELYAAVLRGIEDEATSVIPPDEALVGDAEGRFRIFVRHMVLSMLGSGKKPWARVLMAREFAMPSPPSPSLASMLNNVAVPLNRKLTAIIAELLGTGDDDPDAVMAAASVIAQGVYFLQHYAHLERILPQFDSKPSHEEVAASVIEFSLGAVRAMACRRQAERGGGGGRA